jgi:magnesium and cobalt transporter
LDPEPRRSIFSRLKARLGGGSKTPEDFEREIQGLVDQGEARGLLTPREGEMIEAILDLDDTLAGQIMIPRTELAVAPAEATLEETIQIIVESGHSRIPVFEGDLDHIVGVIHAKDLLPFWDAPSPPANIRKIARQPFFVPQSMAVNELLARFKSRRVHLAVVVDEYGGTAGIATIEDVLEEIVGDISDEYDQEERLLAKQSDGSLLVNARLEVEELANHLGVELPRELPEGRFETVGGFITTLLGRVPKPNDEVEWDQLRMVVVGADDRRVTQVLVHYNQDKAENGD